MQEDTNYSLLPYTRLPLLCNNRMGLLIIDKHRVRETGAVWMLSDDVIYQTTSTRDVTRLQYFVNIVSHTLPAGFRPEITDYTILAVVHIADIHFYIMIVLEYYLYK